MKREKITKLVITFPTTTAAMSMEDACDISLGRLIPVPREIHAGCGLAWCSKPDQEEILMQRMKEYQIGYEDKQLIQLYE